MFITWQTDKRTMVFPYNRTLPNNKKESNTDTHYNMEVKEIVSNKRQSKKIFFLYEFIYTKLLENEISSTAKESRSMTSWNLGDLKRGRKKTVGNGGYVYSHLR